VIGTDFTYTDPSDLPTGQSAPFDITVNDGDLSDDIELVKLAAESSDYFAIDPELAVASTPTTAPQTTEPAPRLVL
jgi:hypothetical protein